MQALFSVIRDIFDETIDRPNESLVFLYGAKIRLLQHFFISVLILGRYRFSNRWIFNGVNRIDVDEGARFLGHDSSVRLIECFER